MNPEKAYHRHGARFENVKVTSIPNGKWELWLETPQGKQVLTSCYMNDVSWYRRQLRELDNRLQPE